MTKKPLSKLQRLVSDTRTGHAEAPQSELDAAKPEPPVGARPNEKDAPSSDHG